MHGVIGRYRLSYRRGPLIEDHEEPGRGWWYWWPFGADLLQVSLLHQEQPQHHTMGVWAPSLISIIQEAKVIPDSWGDRSAGRSAK